MEEGGGADSLNLEVTSQGGGGGGAAPATPRVLDAPQ